MFFKLKFMSELSPISRTQPQIAQLELKFAGPLVKGSIVELFSDLITLTNNYPHKLVWVKEHSCNYYLDNGDGTNLLNWKKSSGRVVIPIYDITNTYSAGDCVYQTGKIYSAKINVPINHQPKDYESHWQVIAGETETYRYLFTNTSSVLIYTEIRNPKFEIILGEFVYDINGTIVFNEETGLAELSNKEIVEAFITQREDLPLNNGVAYEISFYEDSTLSTQVSGCINIK